MLATSAGGQIGGTPRGGYSVNVPLDVSVAPTWSRDAGDICALIHQGRNSGQLTRRDARQLRREAHGIDGLQERYSAGGLSGAETRELDARRLALHDRVQTKRLGLGTEVAR